MPGLHDFELEINYGSIGKALAYAAGKVGAKTIGYEASHLTVEQYQNFQSEVKAELVPADGIIARPNGTKMT